MILKYKDFERDFIVETTTEEEYQLLMDLLDKDGYVWVDKTPIARFDGVEKGFKKGYRFILVNPNSKIIGYSPNIFLHTKPYNDVIKILMDRDNERKIEQEIHKGVDPYDEENWL